MDSTELAINQQQSPRLHEQLSAEEIEELYNIFKLAEKAKFTPHEFREILKKFKIYFKDDKQFETLFLKVSIKIGNL